MYMIMAVSALLTTYLLHLLVCVFPLSHTFFFFVPLDLQSFPQSTSFVQLSLSVMFHTYFFLVAAFAATVISYPNRGHYPFAIALCKHSDRNQEDITKARISEFFTSAGSSKPGMYQYLREMSSGAVDLEGSFLGGWYTTVKTYAQTAAVDRQTRLNICRDAAIAGGMVIPPVRHLFLLPSSSTLFSGLIQRRRLTSLWLFTTHLPTLERLLALMEELS